VTKKSLPSMFRIVENELATFESELFSIIHSPVNLLEDIGDHLRQAGGKRLRPALYLICAKSCSNKAVLMPMAVAIEMVIFAGGIMLQYLPVIIYVLRLFRPLLTMSIATCSRF
jgi:hypothetical protein